MIKARKLLCHAKILCKIYKNVHNKQNQFGLETYITDNRTIFIKLIYQLY